MNEKSSRLVALDLTKGGLVLCMVAYHSLNYSTRYELGFAYMAFLPPSFILIAGFLLSRVYTGTEGGKRDGTRLLSRGLKIAALFTALNIFTALLLGGGPQNWLPAMVNYFAHAYEVYVLGSARHADFVILLPISYLLMLGLLLLRLDGMNRWIVPVLTIAAVVTLALLEQHSVFLVNASLLGAGLVGMVLGKISPKWLEALGKHWQLCILAYAIYAFLAYVLSQTYGMQLVGAILAVATLFGISARFQAAGWLQERILNLGHYSLVAYIGQIAVLQLLVRVFGRPAPGSLGFVALFAATLAATVGMAEMLRWMRCRSRGMDGLYRTVFA